jgi:hypothetical protein
MPVLRIRTRQETVVANNALQIRKVQHIEMIVRVLYKLSGSFDDKENQSFQSATCLLLFADEISLLRASSARKNSPCVTINIGRSSDDFLATPDLRRFFDLPWDATC